MTKSGILSQTLSLRDWSLITGGGGGVLQNVFTLTKRGGGCGKSLSHAEGGAHKIWGSFSVVA